MAATTETVLPTVKVVAQQPIQHDGVFYAIGKSFSCTEAQAEALGDDVTIIPVESVDIKKPKEPAE